MIVLAIDPGTAALGYGIVGSERGRLREIDHGCLETSPDTSLPERLLAIHALVDELIGASFKVKNPNATSSCGCGVSFSV